MAGQTLDAGYAREELVRKVKDLKATNPNICCWSDVLPHVEQDIADVAKIIGKSTAYVFACTIDDIEADLN